MSSALALTDIDIHKFTFTNSQANNEATQFVLSGFGFDIDGDLYFIADWHNMFWLIDGPNAARVNDVSTITSGPGEANLNRSPASDHPSRSQPNAEHLLQLASLFLPLCLQDCRLLLQ